MSDVCQTPTHTSSPCMEGRPRHATPRLHQCATSLRPTRRQPSCRGGRSDPHRHCRCSWGRRARTEKDVSSSLVQLQNALWCKISASPEPRVRHTNCDGSRNAPHAWLRTAVSSRPPRRRSADEVRHHEVCRVAHVRMWRNNRGMSFEIGFGVDQRSSCILHSTTAANDLHFL